MRRKSINKNLLMMILLLFVTIGYAYLNSELKINGTTGIAGNTWDVHFENVVLSSSNTATSLVDPVANPQDKVTNLTYNITFNRPGDVYEFDVDVVNAGSLDAMIELITSTIKIGNGEVQELTNSTLPSYLNYYVKYSDGAAISSNHLLNKETRETIKVHLEYKMDINEDDLTESSGKNIEFNYDIKYVQADDGAKPRPLANNCIYNGELTQGAEYVNGQYTYKYKQEGTSYGWQNISSDGWGVKLTNKNSTDPVTTPLCTTINGKPIVSMSYMFNETKASSIDLSSFDSSNVVNMKNMFSFVNGVTSLDVGYLDTSKVTNMERMFYNTYTLKTIDYLNNFNTKSAINMEYMFASSNYIEKIKITKWDFSNVENINYMFYETGYNSTDLDFEVKNISLSKVLSVSYVFKNLGYNAQKANIRIENINAPSATSVEQIFYNTAFQTLNVDISMNNVDFKNATNVKNLFTYLTYSAYNANVTIKNINIESATNSSNHFAYLGYSSKGNYILNIDNVNIKSMTSVSDLFGYIGNESNKLTAKINNVNINGATSLYETFEQFSENGKELDLTVSNLHARSATNVNYCFLYAGQATNKTIIKVKDWETPELTSTASMFSHVGQTINGPLEITIDNLDMTKVTTTDSMFSSNGESNNGTSKIVFRNISTPSLTDVSNMFNYAGAASSQFIVEGLNNFDFSHVTTFYGMFEHGAKNGGNVTNLGTIDVYGDDISYMFYDFAGAKVILNLHHKPTNYNNLFYRAATNSGAEIIVNYSSEVDNIDDIIATANGNPRVIKGSLIN